MKTISVKAADSDGSHRYADAEMTREEMKALGEAFIEASETGTVEEGAVVRIEGRGRKYRHNGRAFENAHFHFYLCDEPGYPPAIQAALE